MLGGGRNDLQDDGWQRGSAISASLQVLPARECAGQTIVFRREVKSGRRGKIKRQDAPPSVERGRDLDRLRTRNQREPQRRSVRACAGRQPVEGEDEPTRFVA